jgi:hypothetical protein
MLKFCRLVMASKNSGTTRTMMATTRRFRGRLIVWIFCMRFDMLLEILWSLECLLAKLALVWFQGNMYTDM